MRIRTHCRRPRLQPLTDCRVVHRALNSYFDAYSAALGRYIPSRKLQVGGVCGSHSELPCSCGGDETWHETLGMAGALGVQHERFRMPCLASPTPVTSYPPTNAVGVP